MIRSSFINQSVLVVLSLIGCILPLAGCLGDSQSTEKIKEPPFIPAPEAPPIASKEREIPALYVGAYADLMDYGDKTRHNPKLVEAVAHAIQIGVLKPNGVQDRFMAANPVNFSEFRQWTLAYQAAAAGATGLKPTPPAAKASVDKNQPKELVSMVTRTDDLTNPMNPARMMIIPEALRFGAHELANNRSLNREELCALYVFLAKKQDLAANLGIDGMENTTPGGNALNGDEALSMFKDYSAISEWAKPYVAIAYRESILQKTFGLTGARLTIDEGFNPSATVSREEAIVLLNQLYGHVKSPAPKVNQEAPAPKTNQSNSDPGMRGHYTPQSQPVEPKPNESTMERKAGPQPLNNLRTLRESRPDGSRNVQRMERAE